jgi:hypothetical protein
MPGLVALFAIFVLVLGGCGDDHPASCGSFCEGPSPPFEYGDAGDGGDAPSLFALDASDDHQDGYVDSGAVAPDE